jgi:hypothetical protein
MVIAAAVLITWARLRPLVVPAQTGSDDEADDERPPAH